jgi:hypothetical protein
VDPENPVDLMAQVILAVPMILEDRTILYLPRFLEMILQSANQRASLIETSLKRS